MGAEGSSLNSFVIESCKCIVGGFSVIISLVRVFVRLLFRRYRELLRPCNVMVVSSPIKSHPYKSKVVFNVRRVRL